MDDEASGVNPETPPPTVYRPHIPIEGLGSWNELIPSFGVVHAFAWWARARTTLPPPCHTVGAILPVLAHEATRRGYTMGAMRVRPALQTVLVGPSASAKSSSMRLAQELYGDFLQRLNGSFYVDPFVALEGSVPGILEALAGRYDDHLGCTPAIFVAEEFSRILALKDTTSEVLNNVFDGRTITRHLRSYQKQARETGWAPNVVQHPAVSAVVATTEVAIEAHTTRVAAQGGLYSRLLWFHGLPQHVTATRYTAHEEYTAAINLWGAWSAHLEAAELTRGAAAKVLTIDSACNPYFETLAHEVNAWIAGEPHNPLNATRVRGLEHAQTIAMLWAFSRGDTVARADDSLRAIALVRQLFGMVGEMSNRWHEDEAVRCQGMLLSTIRHAGPDGCRKSALYKVVKTRELLERALALLADQELIEVVAVTQARGRPATIYRALTDASEELTSASGGATVVDIADARSRRN